MTNRHPADELADVRAEKKQLEAREAELREMILRDPKLREGDEHTVLVEKRKRTTLDRDALVEEFGEHAIDLCSKTTEATFVTVVRRGANPKAAQMRRTAAIVKGRAARG